MSIVLLEFFLAWERKDLDRLLKCFSPEVKPVEVNFVGVAEPPKISDFSRADFNFHEKFGHSSPSPDVKVFVIKRRFPAKPGQDAQITLIMKKMKDSGEWRIRFVHPIPISSGILQSFSDSDALRIARQRKAPAGSQK